MNVRSEFFNDFSDIALALAKHGDQIFFGSVGNSTHTGLVEKVDSKKKLEEYKGSRTTYNLRLSGLNKVYEESKKQLLY